MRKEAFKNKAWKVFSVAVFVGVLVTYIGIDMAQGASPPEHKWKFYAFTGAVHANTKFFQEFAKEVKEKTDGRLEITVYPGGELPYKAFDVVQIVGQRNVELGDAYTGFIAGDIHLCDVFALPFLVDSLPDVEKAYDSVKGKFDEIFKKRNCRVLFMYSWPPQTIWSVKPLSSLEDLKGRKMRGKSPSENAVFKAFGAVPTTLESADLPTALQRKVIDGIIGTAFHNTGSGIADFLKYGYLIKLHYALDFILVNRTAFDELPLDIQKIVTETAATYQKRMFQEVPVKLERVAREKVKSMGTVLVEPTQKDKKEGVKRLMLYWEEWAKRYGEDAKETLQAIRKAVGK